MMPSNKGSLFAATSLYAGEVHAAIDDAAPAHADRTHALAMPRPCPPGAHRNCRNCTLYVAYTETISCLVGR